MARAKTATSDLNASGLSRFSAEIAAAIRAAAAMESDPIVRSPDFLAAKFLGPFFRMTTKPGIRPIAMWAYATYGPGLYVYWYVLARLRFIDYILLRELDNGVEQIVNLGCGNDSRALRFGDRLRDLPVFESDVKGVIERKKQLLLKFLPRLPTNVVYFENDIDQEEKLHDVLVSAGYDPRKRSLWIAEGVFPYLSQEGGFETLKAFKRSAPGSSYVFDYFLRDVLDGTRRVEGAEKMLKYVIKKGEPLGFGMNPPEFEAYANEQGFEILAHPTPDDLRRTYLVGVDGMERGPMADWLRLTHIRNPIARPA
jgi:methyltransferase (TIGR00027 family)